MNKLSFLSTDQIDDGDIRTRNLFNYERAVPLGSAELVCKTIGGVRYGRWQLVDEITPSDWMSSICNEKWAVSCSVVYGGVISKGDRKRRSERDRLVEERRVFEDLFNESERKNRALEVQLMRVADDLHALRRIMPLATREVRFSRVSDWTIMKEETVSSYLIREEGERTMIEIQRDRTVKVTVIIKDKEIMESCVLVNTRLGDYKCWAKGKEDKSP
ncbi:hypothetical protein RB195_009445 [Necator americanus]|uniref:Uncharacterized protein n=1 Tax=Necator americanus TaxID=51031 RepID=A0ABR1CU47_NECAM